MGRLPHWEVEDGRYFVTLHVSGAIPQTGKDQIRALLAEFSRTTNRTAPKWLVLQRKIFAAIDKWLDHAPQNSWMKNPKIATIMQEAILHRHQRGDWELLQHVVMPNHIHLFLETGTNTLKQVMEDFKRWTGHQSMKLIDAKPKRFWQREWFDHWSRSDEGDDRIIAYIRNNPVKAGLVKHYTDWPYGSW